MRERADDIPELLQFFFAKAKRKHGREHITIPDTLASHFIHHRWPGNIRELENIVERLVVLTPSNVIAIEDLPEYLRAENPPVDALNLVLPPQGISQETIEKELMLRALQKFHWNQTHAAKYLDISRKTLMYRMEKHGLQKPDDVD